MRISKIIVAVSLFLFLGAVSHAALLEDREPGYARFTGNFMYVANQVDGAVAHFSAHNVTNGVIWQTEDGSLLGPRLKRRADFATMPESALGINREWISNPDFSVIADIDISDPLNPFVTDGRIAITGEILGRNDLLLFGASLGSEIGFNRRTIEFIIGPDHEGLVADLGYASFTEELLRFNLRTGFFGKFDGDFSQDFDYSAKAVATVPLPAAFWFLASGVVAAIVRRRKNI